jgi:hypothetical protein
MTEYLGYAICFYFEEDGSEWSVYTNESGVLVTQEPNIQHFQYSDWTKFEIIFPKMAEMIRYEMMKKVTETLAVLNGGC